MFFIFKIILLGLVCSHVTSDVIKGSPMWWLYIK